MSTFTSRHNNRTVTIRQHEDGHGIVVKADSGPAFASVYLDPTDDAAIALAVMEAAERRTPPNPDMESADYARGVAINWLMTARDRTAKESEQAAEETELRGEAWNLYAAYCTIDENTNPYRWGRLMPSEQRRWLAVASIARTMNTEATK